ncbi:hypothetical protein G7048_09625 [Diaphorobacter sp. HDW4B]|uniref:hypothetical protein n=1 Tax=Diaphorobacter sp. HDW4B TaxID=2714925 RepID=UPI001407F4F0|nr:hypothetical protein [Diaphorobacter sp. HDW4B]QIL70589.1 hypothetical protein G7048_09625 [Diaphorobacter sp. HDW4B]
MPPRTASVIPAICGVAEPRNSGAIAAFCALHLIQNHGALHRVHPRQVAQRTVCGFASRLRGHLVIVASGSKALFAAELAGLNTNLFSLGDYI